MRTLGPLELLLILVILLLFFGGSRIPKMAGWLGRRVKTTKDQVRWVYSSMGGSEEDEIEAETAVGAKLAADFREQMPPDPDPQCQAVVNRLGRRLALAEPARKRDFEFQVVTGPSANAYALPGGYVFVTRKLLDLCSDEDEIAFVIGHEMGHVIARHFIGKYTLEWLMSRVQAGQLIGPLLTKGYSREQEYEADRKGRDLVAAGDFSLDGMLRFLRKIESLPRDTSVLAEYFSTHPAPQERISHLQKA